MNVSSMQAMRAGWQGLSFTLSALALACSTTGTAVGELKEPGGAQAPVTLVWKSDAAAPDRGRISGSLPDGTHYSGRYFEVIHTASTDTYAPAWDGWSPYWSEWAPPWSSEHLEAWDWPAFVRIYTGKVIANLSSDDHARRLRCRFTIKEPREGLAGGGSGDCQVSTGEEIAQVVVTSK